MGRAIGIRRVKGLKLLGRRMGDWLAADQAQQLLNSVSPDTLLARKDVATPGVLLGCGWLGCGLRRSEVVGSGLGQFNGESHYRCGLRVGARDVGDGVLHSQISVLDVRRRPG